MNEQTKKEIRKEVSETQVYCQKKLNVLYEERSEQEFNNNQQSFEIDTSEPIQINLELKNKITRIEAKQRDIEMWRQNVEAIITSGQHDGFELQAVQEKATEFENDINNITSDEQ